MRAIVLVCLLFVPAIAFADGSSVRITPDVVYGHKDGLALTFDVFTPAYANGAGVLFMVSGGWYSSWIDPEKMQNNFKPLTDKGFTVFAVRHGSSPRYGIPDAVADVRRAVRFVRMNADKLKIDANRLGVYGMSAGGHLTLMLATAGDDGKADAKDPVEKVSDRIQAAAAFVAPTDLTIMVKDYPQRLPAYKNFPALDLEMPKAESYSPLKHVTSDDAPTLLLVGVKDDLVPIEHSRNIQKEFDAKKVPNKLVEFPNSAHGFGKEDMQKSMAETAAWFEKYLAKKK